MLSASIKKHPLAYFYALSVLIVILIIPVFIVTGAGDAVDRAFQQTDVPFNTDLVTWVRLITAFPSAFPGALLALLQVASPDIAVAIVVGIAYGRKGFLDLKDRSRFWSKEIAWKQGIQTWASCISIFAGMSLATAGLSRFILPVDGFIRVSASQMLLTTGF